jgi:hypothetical protein
LSEQLPDVPFDRITVKNLQHTPGERVINAVCWLSRKLGLPPTDTRLEPILRRARRTTGLADWGDDGFLEGMKVALEATATDEFSSMSQAFVHNVGWRAVSNRLRLAQIFRDKPEIRDIRIERPIFVLGFPRTGTTLLQNLLCLEHDRRGLQFWELTRPLPVHPDPAVDRKKRITATQREIDFATKLVPEMHEVHYIDATTVEECWPLFNNTMAVLNLDLALGIHAYGDWLLQHDMEQPYREYRQTLQVLLHQNPARQLVLKCPEHLWFVDSLLKVFPDACIVWTHRNPFDCVSSYSSMVTLSRRTMKGKVDPHVIGEHITKRFQAGVTRAAAALDAADPARFFHADFYETVTDPKGMVQRIEEHFGLDRTSDAGMQTWLDTPRQDSRGKHVYSAARYGLERGPILERFADYIERFDVKLEKPA